MHTEPPPLLSCLACRPLAPEWLFLPSVHVFDPVHGVDVQGDLLVGEGEIKAVAPQVERPAEAEVLEDLAGCWVLPGLVDPHVHLRTPGFEYKEDLLSGSSAAAAGGYVTVIAMANTAPVIDSGPLAQWVFAQAGREAMVHVGQVGAVTKGLAGEELAEMHELAEAGVAAYSDDGRPLAAAGLFLQALRYARITRRPLFLHEEDRSLSFAGVMHEGKWSARLGLPGIPGVCESGPLARDLEIIRYAQAEAVRLTGEVRRGSALNAPPATPLVHFQHLSAAESVELVRRAKAEGLAITAEVTPHHLLLTDERLNSGDANLKINPPLRSEADREALVAALADGTIDCVATDHAPHAPQEKEVPLEAACFGTVGLETAFAALYTGLVRPGALSLARLVEAMSAAPCRMLGIAEPSLVPGAPADFAVVDLDEVWQVTPAALQGKSRNSAFLGERFGGRVCMTVVDGARRFARTRGAA